MTRAASFTITTIRRAVQAAVETVKAGDKVAASVEFYPDGRFKVLIAPAGAAEVTADPYEEWRKTRGDRAA